MAESPKQRVKSGRPRSRGAPRIKKDGLLQDVREFWRNRSPCQLNERRPPGRSVANPPIECDVASSFRGGTPGGGVDQGQFGGGNAGFQKTLTIMGGIGRIFPAEIPQMPFDGQVRKAGQQGVCRLSRFLGSPQLSKG